MSEFTSSSPDAPFDHVAFAKRAHDLARDSWRLKALPQYDFAGKVISRATAETMFGNFDADAPLAVRIDRVQRMARYARGLTDGPGGWIDSVLGQIKAATRDIALVDTSKYPSQAARRAELVRMHAELVERTEVELEGIIRKSLFPDRLPYLNASAGLNFRTAAVPIAPPVTRREVEKAEAWTAEKFILRLRANGVFAQRDDEALGFSWSNGIALSPADRATLASKFDEIGLFLAGRPDLIGPPAPPPPPPVYVSPAAQASVAVEATAEAPTVAEVPPAAPEMATPVAPEAAGPGMVEVPPIPPAAPDAEAVATPSTAPVEPKKRRAHAYATHRLPSR